MDAKNFTIIKTEPTDDFDHEVLPNEDSIISPSTSKASFSQSVPFCSLCLRERISKSDIFYEYNADDNRLLLDSIKDIFGFELHLKKCHICTPCRKLIRLVENFRTCCLKANSWAEQHVHVERVAVPESLKGKDRWFFDGTVQAIDMVKGEVEERIKQIDGYSTSDIFEITIKTEAGEAEVGHNFSGIPVTRKKILNCEKCNRLFDGPRSYTAHLKCCKRADETQAGELFACQICSVSFRRQLDLEAHTNMHEGNKPYECRVTCGERFYGKNQRYRHEKVCRKNLGVEKAPVECSEPESEQEPMELNECDRCHRRFDGRQSLVSHMVRCQNENESKKLHTCEICSTSFVNRMMLKAHINKHKGIKPYKCRKFCDKKFYGTVHRYRHEHVCREVVVETVECEGCHRVFGSVHGLAVHQKSCRQNEEDDRLMYKCDVCSISFTHKYQLEAHGNKHKGIKPFECEFNCGKTFFGAQQLKKHVQVCNKRPFPIRTEDVAEDVRPGPEPEPEEEAGPTLEVIQCENCNRLFDCKGGLLSHLRYCRPGDKIDESKLLYTCHICSISFARKPRLQAHLNKHNGIKAFECKFKCGESFFNLKPKNQHEKNCQTIRCKACKAEFSTSESLVNHIKEAHGSGKLTCETCGMQFLKNFNLQRHKQIKHPEATVNVENIKTECENFS